MIFPNGTPDGPEARSYHSATSINDNLYIFGGCGSRVSESSVAYFGRDD